MKNTLKLCMIGLMVLAGIAVLSCTDGEFVGTDGGGNLNIIGIPSEYKYCSVSVTGSGVTVPLTFNPESPRIAVKSGAVKAPLYTSEGLQYTNSNNGLTVTATVYETVDGPAIGTPKTFPPVKFYAGGSGLVEWK